MENEKTLNDLLESVANDKWAIEHLQNIALKHKQYALGAQLRDIKDKNFPETPEEVQAREQSFQYKGLFGMIGLKMSSGTSWILYEAVKKHMKLKGKFSLKDAAELVTKHEEYFNPDK